VLARLQDQRIKEFLASKGLKADSIGDQGYLLFSDDSHLIVAANTGQGLFYGVQTLRQLLHPDGKTLICPAVSIRDWPSMEWRGVQDDISRGPIPTEDFMKRQIRTLAGLQGESVRPLHGACVRFCQPAVGGAEGSRAHSAGNQRSSGLCQAALRHNSSRTTDLRASPSHLEVRDLFRCRGAPAWACAHAYEGAVVRSH